MTLVVDASAITELLLTRPGAPLVERELVAHGFDLHAPQLLDIEVLSALRGLVRSGEAAPPRADEAIEDLHDLPIERHAHLALVPRIWELRKNFTTYDATYVALAEHEDVPLLTADGRLARAVRGQLAVDVTLVASVS